MGNRKLWKTKDGKKIRIKDMSDSHLLNTIKYLDKAYLNYLWNTMPDLQGDMAQFCAEQDFNHELENGDPSLVWPIYADLVVEAIKRGIAKKL